MKIDPMPRLAAQMAEALKRVNEGFDKFWPDTEDLRDALGEHRLSMLNAIAIASAVAASEIVLGDPGRRSALLDATRERRLMLRDQRRPPMRPSRSRDPSRGTLSAATLSLVQEEFAAAPVERLMSVLWLGFFHGERDADYDPDALRIVRRVILWVHPKPRPTPRQVGDSIRKRARRVAGTMPDSWESSFYNTRDVRQLARNAFHRWRTAMLKHEGAISPRLRRLIVRR